MRDKRPRHSTTACVTVDVDIEEFSVDAIVEYLEERGYTVIAPGDGTTATPEAHQAYEALAAGRADALEIVRRFISNQVGRIL
jgi:CheY-like chemotaxis protein